MDQESAGPVKVAVVGSLTVDLTMQVPRLPRRGDNLRVSQFQIGAGGKGANAATAIARMGGSAILIGCLGQDVLGELELTRLHSEGINTDGVVRTEHSPTTVAMILVEPEGHNTVMVANWANEQLTGSDVHAGLAPHWDDLKAILVNLEASDEAIAVAIQAGKKHQIPTIMDAGPARPIAREIWREATILSPNADETTTLVGYPLTDLETIHRAGRELLDAGPEAVVLKLGKKGALVMDRDQEVWFPALPVETVDVTGAGDAFTAALTLLTAENHALAEAAEFAVAAGAVATTRLGTLEAMPSRTEVLELLHSRHLP